MVEAQGRIESRLRGCVSKQVKGSHIVALEYGHKDSSKSFSFRLKVVYLGCASLLYLFYLFIFFN